MIVYGNRKDGSKSPTVQEPYEPGAKREPPKGEAAALVPGRREGVSDDNGCS